jgi:adenosylhomocysteine nucleosidase
MAIPNNQLAFTERTGRVLVVAALARELAALKRDADPRITLLETGEGPANAERTLGARLESEPPRAVVGIGFAGALSPLLAVSDLLVARKCRTAGAQTINTTQGLLEAARRMQSAGMALRFGVIVTVDEIICQAAGKRRLAATVAPDELASVDMESSTVARLCSERGIPFLVARCISDLFAEDLPLDFNRCRRPDGRTSDWKVVRSAFRRPSSIKPLWELRRRSIACSEKLAGFVRSFVGEID